MFGGFLRLFLFSGFLRLFLFSGKGSQHGFGDEDDAAFANAEALFVQLGIDADLHAIRDTAVAVDDAATQDAVLANAYLRQNDGVFDVAAFGDLDAVKEDGVTDFRIGNHAAAANQRVINGADMVVLVEEFGRCGLFRHGTDRPAFVEYVELRVFADKVDVRAPVAVDGTHVAPVDGALGVAALAGFFEGVGVEHAFAHGSRDDVVTEVVRGVGAGRFAFEDFVEVVGVEDVDAHRGQ